LADGTNGPAAAGTELVDGGSTEVITISPETMRKMMDSWKPKGVTKMVMQPKTDRRAQKKSTEKTAEGSPDGTDRPIVVDTTNHIAGRLSSHVAKLLLQGKRVSLVNCEKIMISGTRSNIIHEYRQFLKINSIINPKHGPVHYRRPDTIISKMVRGMLPFEKKPSGKTAYKRLRTYIGSPKELKSIKRIQFEKAKIKRTPSSYVTMKELCRVIGWTE